MVKADKSVAKLLTQGRREGRKLETRRRRIAAERLLYLQSEQQKLNAWRSAILYIQTERVGSLHVAHIQMHRGRCEHVLIDDEELQHALEEQQKQKRLDATEALRNLAISHISSQVSAIGWSRYLEDVAHYCFQEAQTAAKLCCICTHRKHQAETRQEDQMP